MPQTNSDREKTIAALESQVRAQAARATDPQLRDGLTALADLCFLVRKHTDSTSGHTQIVTNDAKAAPVVSPYTSRPQGRPTFGK